MPDLNPPALLTLRAALIFTIALLAGATAGCLTFLAQHDLAQAALAGCGALAVSIGLLNRIIARS
ncbi:hypothetical protein E1293_38375 [Actinomadura darangshiensis]|uniref:Uncharacterized protein n=1 Tax=Actinomadura darangshiensis TaxID=705336 RepID=A0A4R5A5B9_9ACTN|nr:hypothetical protein [Actinomadura darangshiensis]TDD67131.1 hypothetical protein E1293_38375 [Actinomadura darangshiensis]